MSDRSYIPGSTVTITGRFRLRGVPQNPPTVRVRVKNPAGTVTYDKTYPTDAEVVADGGGQFHYDVVIPAGSANVGGWTWRMEGSTPVGAAQEGVILVTPTAF